MTWIHKQFGDTFVLGKRFPVQFDLLAETIFPLCRSQKLALQIRQDMWRLLQNVRGLLPAVEVTGRETGMYVRAGGQLTCSVQVCSAQVKLQNMLENPAYRQRWINYAVLKRGVSL